MCPENRVTYVSGRTRNTYGPVEKTGPFVFATELQRGKPRRMAAKRVRFDGTGKDVKLWHTYLTLRKDITIPQRFQS
jgi:hypothetical protein